MEARYLLVANRDKFQHYKKRNPPWIKLYRALITGEDKQLDDFLILSEEEQWQLVRIWLVAAQCENHLLAYDETWMRRAIRSVKKVPLEKFIRLGFLELLSAEEADAFRFASKADSTLDSTADSKTPEISPTELTEVSEIEEEVLLEDSASIGELIDLELRKAVAM